MNSSFSEKDLLHPLIPLNSPDATLETVGGKALNLAKLANAGFAVPNGFLLPTSVYREYVRHNDLAPLINEALHDIDITSPEALSAASDQIRSQFRTGGLPPELASTLESGWPWLGANPVAVRSSATAEDLPDLSFAGQQDTYLNVVGTEALLEAVVNCWSSLWTARAIGYRARSNIPHDGAALAVVVQEMVISLASGVLFTANPLSGLRSESVVDATLGLGEALVGGHVEPDHYVVDTYKKEITHTFLGSKTIIIRGQPGGGVAAQEVATSQQEAIPDEVILDLVKTGQEIEALYGFPQDIEWAYLPSSTSLGDSLEPGDDLYILQSRPITSLFPIPDGMEPHPLQVLFSFGAVQGINDPMTPLGQDAIRFIFAGGASLFGFEVDHETQGIIKIAGERLWGNMTALIRHPIGARLAPRFFSAIEPGSLQALDEILADPQLGAGKGRLRFNTFWRLVSFAGTVWKRIIYFARRPEGKSEQIRHLYQAEIARLQAKSDQISGKDSPQGQSELFRKIYNGFVYAVPEIATAAAAGLIPLFILNRFSNHLTGSGDLALEVTRGLPNNVTTEMDLKLWETARIIRADNDALHQMRDNTDEALAALYLQDELPKTAQDAIASFLDEYGMRGLGEIDIGRPRWREQPAQIMQILRSYLQIDDESMAPDVVFERGERAAEKAIGELEAAARGTFGGRIKARVVRAAARRVRALAGLRESPKFFIIQIMGIIRKSLLDWGRELVDAGRLNNPDDLFYLYYNELEAFDEGNARDWKNLIVDRRQNYEREKLRMQIPRLLQSDGRAFYEGIITSESEAGTLVGSPVSPGVVEGSVRVVLDPQHANLAPGEILVCPGTDPAWTPLFLAAGGLVLEVGGMMTHGAIVAREYGIPAVVGVDRATERLITGMLIKVDGSSGVIEIL